MTNILVCGSKKQMENYPDAHNIWNVFQKNAATEDMKRIGDENEQGKYVFLGKI